MDLQPDRSPLSPVTTPWGEFGGRCLIGSTMFEPDLLSPSCTTLGLQKKWSALLGTWRDENGATYRFLRVIDGFATRSTTYFTSSGGGQLRRHADSGRLYRGGVIISRRGDLVRFGSPPRDGSPPFIYEWSKTGSLWQEEGLLDVRGVPLEPAHHWYNPWPGRAGLGTYVVSEKSLSEGVIAGRRMAGVFTHEIHFFPPGYDWFKSPYGAGGMEITWGHFVTEFQDGTIVDADLAFGREGWGFAILREGKGPVVGTTDVLLRAEVRANGYPSRLYFSFLGQEWVWKIAPDGERSSPERANEIPIIGAEGILTRMGDDRPVARAMGTIDWWADGRADSIIVNKP